jgi:xylulokinase
LGLSLSTGPAELARAIAEGICLAIRDVIAVMEEKGAAVEELRVTGAPGESPFLNQLKADVSGRPVLVPGNPAKFPPELLGLTALGAAALGAYGSAEEAAGALVEIEAVFSPDTEQGPCYEGAFETYRELYRTLKPQFMIRRHPIGQP